MNSAKLLRKSARIWQPLLQPRDCIAFSSKTLKQKR